MDWAGVKTFERQNLQLRETGFEIEAIFIGDSLTEFWSDNLPSFFPPQWVNRGISGQTTPQMLVRFRPDVIDLSPRLVHIMAGTNDVYGNTGPMRPEEILGNIKSMVELASYHRIAVVLALVPPSHGKMLELNGLIKSYAATAPVTLADYHTPLDDGTGSLSERHSYDHLHLTQDGYQIISAVARRAIEEALSKSGRRPPPARDNGD